MQNFLTNRVWVLQIAVWSAIFWSCLDVCDLETAKIHQETEVNASWQVRGGPMSRSAEDYHHAKCGFRHRYPHTTQKDRILRRRNG